MPLNAQQVAEAARRLDQAEKSRTPMRQLSLEHAGMTIGDCAAFWHPGLQRRLRLESWHHARQHAAAVAANIAGQEKPYRALPRGWTVQYDVNLIMAGEHAGADEVKWVSEAPRIAQCLKGGIPVAAYGFNAPRQMRDAMALIEKHLT